MKHFAGLLGVAAWGFAAAATALPDLVISSVTLSATRAYPGDSIRIDSVTRNNGDATGWWKYCDVHYYWGTASNLRAVKIGSGVTPNYNELNGIDKGEEEEDTISSWKIPEGTAPGTYYVTCVADGGNAISESNESNNSKSVRFTVIGTPSFSEVQWRDPRHVSVGDTVTAYGECANIAYNKTLTLEVYRKKTLGDTKIATYYPSVRAGNGYYYFVRSITASWDTGEYYFKVSYTQDGNAYSASSGTADGEILNVSDDRMKPSYARATPDFYYDNDSGSGSSVTGPSSGTVALTDDRIPVILVHGMGGDQKPNSLNYWYGWMNADSGYPLGYFNQSPMSSMFRVYRYVYDTRDFISTNGVRFADFVNDFYASHPEFAERQVVVVAHSMGGLVSRYAMNVNTQFAARVHRLVTLGSPHLGAQGANPTWIKYSGPDDNSWFISSIYNTFDLHNNTAGCFDLGWYSPAEIPSEARTAGAVAEMGDAYNTNLLARALSNPFAGWAGMISRAADNKCVLFGGSSTNRVSDNLGADWPKAANKEVSTDHLGLWVATKIYRSMSYADGTGVGDNDGLVPVISALMSDTLSCAPASLRNGHPSAAKFNLNQLEGQQVDHASYLDVPVTMDSVKASLLTIARGWCQPAEAVSAGARWRLVDTVTGETSPWQKSGVRLPALVPGRQYTIQFKSIGDEWTTPGSLTFAAKKSVTKVVTGTYVPASGGGNHAPGSVELSNAGVDEGSPIGTVVGTLSATDADGDEVTFSLVDPDGRLAIDGNDLVTAQVFDYDDLQSFGCTVRATDANGASTDAEFTIAVLDVDETTPAEATGPAWLALSWDPVPGATDYRVDVTAGTTSTPYVVPKAPLGTNEFLADQWWRYEAPGGATTTASGSVKTSPAWFTYGTTNAHALFGTNGIALVTADLPLCGAAAATIDFTHGNWNGGGDTNVSLIRAYCRIDGGEWQFVGESTATGPRDGGEVSFWQDGFVESPAGASTVAFKLEAPNAWRDDWQRGPYVTEAVATLYGQPDFEDADVHLAGYPRMMAVTEFQIQNLPADTRYWYHLEALVDGEWVDVAWGSKLTEDTVPAPTGLAVAADGSTTLDISWTDPGNVDHFEVALTPVVASGVQKEISSAPNVNLLGDANQSGWNYSADHAETSSGWFCKMASETSASTNDWDYHGLVVAPLPGVQSPALDLSGFESATLRFIARVRGPSQDGVEGVPMVLYYSTDDGATWTAADSVVTNTIYIKNNNFLYLDLPQEALVDGARIELGVPGATGTNGVWHGDGNGVRNLTLLGVGKPAPDYDAETAIALMDVPSPLADAVEPSSLAQTSATGLDMDTTYWVRVRAVDAWGHASEWVEASASTTDPSAPRALALSNRSITENNAVGAYIGQLSALDDDIGDVLTYTLADGEGADDNALVEVQGDTLRAAAVFLNSEAATRRVRIRATDAQGLWTEEVFELSVEAAAAPPAGVLVDSATLAAMAAANGVAFVSVGGADDGESIRARWEPVAAAEGSRAPRSYDVYVSTNLLEGFSYDGRVSTNEVISPREGSARFWVVLVAE